MSTLSLRLPESLHNKVREIARREGCLLYTSDAADE